MDTIAPIDAKLSAVSKAVPRILLLTSPTSKRYVGLVVLNVLSGSEGFANVLTEIFLSCLKSSDLLDFMATLC